MNAPWSNVDYDAMKETIKSTVKYISIVYKKDRDKMVDI